jgi:AcrR family transcriptional regulator
MTSDVGVLSGRASGTLSRREEILELAADLFARQGVDKTTVREIGKAVGMLSGSLYHYFDSKELMVAEIVAGYLEGRLEGCLAIAARIPEPQDRLGELLQTEFRDIAQSSAARLFNNESIYVLGVHPFDHIRDLALAVRQIWIDTITEGIRSGVFRSDIDPEVFYAVARKTAGLALQMWAGALTDGPYRLAERHGAENVTNAWIKILLHGFSC